MLNISNFGIIGSSAKPHDTYTDRYFQAWFKTWFKVLWAHAQRLEPLGGPCEQSGQNLNSCFDLQWGKTNILNMCNCVIMPNHNLLCKT